MSHNEVVLSQKNQGEDTGVDAFHGSKYRMPSISDRYATHTRDWLPSSGMIARMLRMDGRPGGHVESTKVQNGATVINHAADAIIKK